MSGCSNPNCKCGASCSCVDGCSCKRTIAEATFGGLRNYNMEPDCDCGPYCDDCNCECHKDK